MKRLIFRSLGKAAAAGENAGKSNTNNAKNEDFFSPPPLVLQPFCDGTFLECACEQH